MTSDFTPAATPFIFGAEPLITRFLDSRLPQSMILSGPKGVGKATFAYHLARYLFQGKRETFSVDPETPLFARVANRSHGDLKVIQRGLNAAGKPARDISIDSVRDVIQFLQSTPREGGWRVVIIDSADALNRKAANALLKVMEEPPSKTLLILISHSLGRILPTLKSRCHVYKMLPLAESKMNEALARLLPEASERERFFLASCAEGCPGRAIALSHLGGEGFYEHFLRVLKGVSAGDLRPALALIDLLLGAADAEIFYETFGQFFSWWLGQALFLYAAEANKQGRESQYQERTKEEKTVTFALLQTHSMTFWTSYWSHATKMLMQTQEYSLDRRHVLLCLFYEMMAGEINPDLQRIA